MQWVLQTKQNIHQVSHSQQFPTLLSLLRIGLFNWLKDDYKPGIIKF